MSTDHVVERGHGATRGRFVIRLGRDEAELTYSITTPTLVIADHTGVPDSFRGKGAGLAPVEAPVEAPVAAPVAAARTEGVKVVPLCPFVNAARRKHPDWADVFV